MHWRDRLTGELARLVTDIEATEALAERWCGKCAEGLHELKALQEQKQKDLDLVLAAVANIKSDLASSSMVAKQPGLAPMLLVPRYRGHPTTGALLQSARLPPSTLYTGKAATPARNRKMDTWELSRNISRQSPILNNSPDHVSKRLVF